MYEVPPKYKLEKGLTPLLFEKASRNDLAMLREFAIMRFSHFFLENHVRICYVMWCLMVVNETVNQCKIDKKAQVDGIWWDIMGI